MIRKFLKKAFLMYIRTFGKIYSPFLFDRQFENAWSRKRASTRKLSSALPTCNWCVRVGSRGGVRCVRSGSPPRLHLVPRRLPAQRNAPRLTTRGHLSVQVPPVRPTRGRCVNSTDFFQLICGCCG